MFSYTRSVIGDTIDSIRKTAHFLDLFFQLFYIGYLIFSLIVGGGFRWAYGIFLALSVAYFVFTVILGGKKLNKEEKKRKRQIKFWFKFSKKLVQGAVIAINVIRLCVAPSENNVINILFLVLMIVGFVVSLALDIIVEVISMRFRLMAAAIEADVNKIKNTILAPVNAVKEFMGRPTEKKDNDGKLMNVLENIKEAREALKEKRGFFKNLFFRNDENE